MVIDVSRLRKVFGATVAVDNISFGVEKGEIVGFLGPNGAGKTTTMRILTCFLPATAGAASVGGYDVFTDSLRVRRQIGYLPENVPLYPEMRVTEYLSFRAKIKGLSRADRKKRMAECLELCGIEDVQRKLIGALSKGYRQRVGLADALIHNPPILILDEPTIGLDPNQIRQVRRMICDLGRDHTILLSTHILTEAEMICGRVIIIHKGRLLMQDTPERIAAGHLGARKIRLEVRGPGATVKTALEGVPGVKSVHWDGREPVGIFTVKPEPGHDVRESLFKRIAKNEWALLEMHRQTVSLEDIFVELTAPNA